MPASVPSYERPENESDVCPLAMKLDAEHNNNVLTDKTTVLTMTGSEAMRGQLVLMAGQGVEQRVLVKVYKTTLEHFAIVCPNKRVAKPVGCINLRNTIVEPLTNCDRSFRIVPRSCDGITLQFRADSTGSRSRWLVALRTQESPISKMKSPTTLALPVLVEDDEE